MSRGPGRVQRALISAFEQQPSRKGCLLAQALHSPVGSVEDETAARVVLAPAILCPQGANKRSGSCSPTNRSAIKRKDVDHEHRYDRRRHAQDEVR